MKYYIATSRHEIPKHNRLRKLLLDLGWKCTCDWTTRDFMQPLNHQNSPTIAVSDIQGIQHADIVIFLIPGGPGAHVELGAAIASNKIVVVSSETLDDAALLQRGDLFYFYPGVNRHLGSVEDLAKWLLHRVDVLPRVLTSTTSSAGRRSSAL